METGKETLEIMSKATFYNSWLLGKISRSLKGEILEVGAGRGNFTKSLGKYGKVTDIDYDPTYTSSTGRKNAHYGDIEKGKYFFSNKKFDSIVCMNVLEHIKDDKRALLNMYNLLNRGGRLILLVPAHMIAYGPMDKNLGHYRRYSKDDAVRKVKRAGFKVIRAEYLNRLGLLGWLVNSRILKREIIPGNQLGFFDKIAKPFLMLEEFVPLPFGLSVLVIAQKT